MSTTTLPSIGVITRAAARREWLSHRLNRFLYAHLALVAVAGLLPLLTPGEALVRVAPWWLLHAVLYAVSLSATLLGLSSAHAEAEEFVWLLGQPAGIGPWLTGKAAALIALVGASALLLGLPCVLVGGASPELLAATAGAAGVAIVCALLGLALGFWIRDSVRGLIAAVGAWFLLLFGTDLLLLAAAGAPFMQDHSSLWVAPLMLNPLDAYRVMILFTVERAAFSEIDAGQLAGWWADSSALWLASIAGAWAAVMLFLAWLGARRRLDC